MDPLDAPSWAATLKATYGWSISLAIELRKLSLSSLLLSVHSRSVTFNEKCRPYLKANINKPSPSSSSSWFNSSILNFFNSYRPQQL